MVRGVWAGLGSGGSGASGVDGRDRVHGVGDRRGRDPIHARRARRTWTRPAGRAIARRLGMGGVKSLRREVSQEKPSPVVDRFSPFQPWRRPGALGCSPGNGQPVARNAALLCRWQALVGSPGKGRGLGRGNGAPGDRSMECRPSRERGGGLGGVSTGTGLVARVAQNIAAASGLLGDPERSANQYLRALDLMPDVAQLRLEAIEALIAANRFPQAVALAQAAPESSFAGQTSFPPKRGPLCSTARSGLPKSVLKSGLEVADLREGEVSLSDLWLLCRRRCTGPVGSPAPSSTSRRSGRPLRTCPSSTTSGWMTELR